MQPRNLKIDLLRGVAILFVILLHLNIRVPFSETFIGANMPATLYKLLFWSGFYGVCIFFVISGFLITTSTLNKWDSLAQVKPLEFYKMRFARIFPLLIALLLILSILDIAGVEQFIVGQNNNATLSGSLLSAITFNINWYEMKVGYLPGSWDVLWSLSIEEVFYLVFPIACIFTYKQKYFISFMILLIIIAPLFRTVWFVDNELGDKNNFACMDGIALGCISAIVAKKKMIKPTSLLIIQIIGWSLLGGVLLFRTTLYEIGISKIGLNVTLLSIGVSLLLIYWHKQYLNGNNRVMSALSWLSFFGKNSYEVYLTHMFLVIGGVALFKYLELANWWIWVLYITVIALSAIVGEVIAHYFSNPLNKYLRQRFRNKANS